MRISITRKGYIVVDGKNHVEEKEAVEHAVNLAVERGEPVPIQFSSLLWMVTATAGRNAPVTPGAPVSPTLSALTPVPTAPTTADITLAVGDIGSLHSAIQDTANHVIMLRGGTHSLTSFSDITRSGTASNPVWIMSYPGEEAWIDFVNGDYMSLNADYVYWYRIGFKRSAWNKSTSNPAIGVRGSHNRAIYCAWENSNGTPFFVYYGDDNLALRCSAYWTDAATVSQPGNVDGFSTSCAAAFGQNNGVSGCTVVRAPDDGIDTWQSLDSLIEGNFLLHIGKKESGASWGGDGNALKLGRGLPPEGTWTYSDSGLWYLSRNITRWNVAYSPRVSGLDTNTGADGDLYGNTLLYADVLAPDAGNNPTPLPSGNVAYNTLRNNLQLSGSQSEGTATSAKDSHNSWNLGLSVTAADFKSLTAPDIADVQGKMGDTVFDMMTAGAFKDFARLAAGSSAIGAATPVGDGHADLGAYDYA